jgi:flagellar protein FlaI
VHANNAEETITRLTNPPIEVPKSMLPALSMIVVQTRNRRTGVRRTFQIAEITKESEPRVLMQYDLRRDKMSNIAHSKSIMDTLHLYTGISGSELRSHLNEKEKILKWLVKKNLNTVDSVGDVMAQYYTGGKLAKLLS